MKWKTLLILGLILTNGFAEAAEPYPQGDGHLRLYNYHLDEFAEIEFRHGEKLIPEALAKVNQLLRSRDNAETIKIDPKLLNIIDHLQDHFGADTIEIISGYRRPEFNERLLKSGRKVSPKSLHMQGRAMDIHIDEIREETLRDYLLSLKLGGVGYYGPLDFVHVDTGPFKTWGERKSGERKLIGVLQTNGVVSLTSDKNDYLSGEDLRFIWSFQPNAKIEDVDGLQLQHFFRGKWRTCPGHSLFPRERGAIRKEPGLISAKSLSCPQEENTSRRFGKYRWVFRVKGESGLFSSNEWYLKKK